MKRTAILAGLIAALAAPGTAEAFQDKLLLSVMSPSTINIDGSTQDWYDAEYPVLSLAKRAVVIPQAMAIEVV